MKGLAPFQKAVEINLDLCIKRNKGILSLNLPGCFPARSYRFEHFATVGSVLGFILFPTDILDFRHVISMKGIPCKVASREAVAPFFRMSGGQFGRGTLFFTQCLAHFAQGDVLKLPDTLAGHPEVFSDFLQRL